MKLIKIAFITLFFMILFSSCAPPSVTDVKLKQNSTIYAGEGDVCENPYIKMPCRAGLDCMLVASKPNIIKVCYPPGTKLDEDLINRHLYDNEDYEKGQQQSEDNYLNTSMK